MVDELIAVDGLPSIAVAGYSLGGNLALKLAGEYGGAAPPQVRAVAAVSPILEISQCVRALERRGNLLYEWNFVRDLKRRMQRKDRLQPGRFDLSRLAAIRTVREFDDAYTAPYFGFADAEDYYHRASAMRVIDRIRVPALIITAEDDPFVPSQPFRDPKVTGNPSITLHICRHGGHCGFVGQRNGGDDDGYWAENQIVEFVAAEPKRPGLQPAAPLRSLRCSLSVLEVLHQQLRELRTLSLFLVLEIHEHVAAVGGLARDRVGPARDVVRRVAFVAQAEIRVVGGDPDRRRQLLAVGDAEREVPPRQPLEHSSSSQDGCRNSNAAQALGGSSAEERVEQRQVLLQVGRQLKEQGAELVAERRWPRGRTARRARRCSSAGCRA